MSQTDEHCEDAPIACARKNSPNFACFISRWRTKLSQILGVVFVLIFIFSEKKLEYSAPFTADVMFAAGCVLIGVATVGRLWCAQYIAGYKTETLVTYGPYSVCRNPLYFFSFCGGVGVGFCTESITLTLLIVVVFALIYPVTIVNEERNRKKVFGAKSDKYVARVPRFIPKPWHFAKPEEYTVKPRVFRREAVDAMYFIWIVGLLEILENLIDMGFLPVLISIY